MPKQLENGKWITNLRLSVAAPIEHATEAAATAHLCQAVRDAEVGAEPRLPALRPTTTVLAPAPTPRAVCRVCGEWFTPAKPTETVCGCDAKVSAEEHAAYPSGRWGGGK